MNTFCSNIVFVLKLIHFAFPCMIEILEPICHAVPKEKLFKPLVKIEAKKLKK